MALACNAVRVLGDLLGTGDSLSPNRAALAGEAVLPSEADVLAAATLAPLYRLPLPASELLQACDRAANLRSLTEAVLTRAGFNRTQ